VLDPTNPLTWWRLCRKIRADNPDLVILQWWVPYWTPSLRYISRWIKKHTRARIVYICHNVVPHEGGGVLDRRFALTVLRQGDSFIVHSDQDLHRLHALLPNAKVVKAQLPTYAEVVQRGLSNQGEHLREQLGLHPEQHILLFFGFVRPYKGLEYLIQALPAVLQQVNVHLLVVGEFWSSPEFYQRYAREYAVESAITFVNRYVADEELAPYFDLAEVVVLPYISATQSAVIQLAFGFGKPVITTRVGGLHEVVNDGVNGLVVPPQDEVALAEAIERYFRLDLGPAMARQIQQETHTDAFAWHKLVTCIEQIGLS
jgi:glycosyltransferase involved in cell wall biosynthesis